MKKKVSVLICLLCVVFLVLGLAACNEEHKHTTCEICGLCTDASCTGSASEKCQGHNTDGEDPIIKDGLTYQLNDADGVATIIAADSSFNGDIPSKITRSSQAKEYSVTRIEAKIGNSTISAISIPDSVTFIATDAFEDCSGLTSATIPTLAIDYIPKNNLETIVITSGNSINAGAFSDCSSITSITLPFVGATKDGTDNTHFGYIFGASSYSDNSTSVPASLKTVIITGGSSIGYNAFKDCSSITSITLPFVGATKDGTDNTHFGYIFGASSYSDNSTSVPDSLKTVIITGGSSIRSHAFYGCSSITSITLPFVGATKDGTDNTHFGYIFGASMFEDNGSYVPASLKTVIITGGSSIGYNAFEGCSSLESITIPDSVASIGEDAFSGTAWYNNQLDGLVYAGKVVYTYKGTMPSNTGITIKEGTLGIAASAFSDCIGLTSITIPDSVTSIGSSAFSGCSSLTSITIPDSVTSIGNGAFSGTAWYNNQPDGLVYAGKVVYTYKGTMPSNSEITIKEGTLGISAYAFSDCSSLTSITIPDSVISIGSHAFRNCRSLTSITIPDSVTSIGDRAFYGCRSLTSITIPDSVTYIGSYAFSGCSSLESITIPDGVTSIGSHAFYHCSSLTSITIPDSVTSIGYSAFYNCSGLTSITIPDGVTYIDSYAFYGCSSLESITIPDSVTYIGSYAFSGCSSLTSIIIPDSVTSIGNGAFESCSSLTSITLPDSVISIGSFAFYGCRSLTSITIPDSVTSIGSYAFSGCSSLTSITIPDRVTSIGSYAFSGCSSLTSITIPDRVTSIDSYAFSGCSSLTSIQFRGTKSQWNAISKGDDWNSGTGNYTITYSYGE